MSHDSPHLARLRLLARGEPEALAGWLRQTLTRETLLTLIVTIIAGCALYGFGLGLWRAPLQGVFVAVKMPLLIFLTLLVNGLINGMLGLLLGSGMSFRQTVVACLMSFAIFSLIVGSFSPLIILWVLDSPPPGQPGGAEWYRIFLLGNTAIIAFAGIVANHKLLGLIQAFSGDAAAGWRTLVAWLAGNLFVGAQLSYILRPFFGNPELPVQFLRPNPLEGNFYEAVWGMLRASIGPDSQVPVTILTIMLIATAMAAISNHMAKQAGKAFKPIHPPPP
ncbi:hypothetical protein [Brevifollis gellanilyticus]|nr:hypothetical protein [Brevifollis gellanilyticus]